MTDLQYNNLWLQRMYNTTISLRTQVTGVTKTGQKKSLRHLPQQYAKFQLKILYLSAGEIMWVRSSYCPFSEGHSELFPSQTRIESTRTLPLKVEAGAGPQLWSSSNHKANSSTQTHVYKTSPLFQVILQAV